MRADIYTEKREGFHHLYLYGFPADAQLCGDGFISKAFIPAHFKNTFALGRQLTNGRLYERIDLVVIKLPVRLKILLRIVLLNIISKRLRNFLPHFIEDFVTGYYEEIIIRTFHRT